MLKIDYWCFTISNYCKPYVIISFPFLGIIVNNFCFSKKFTSFVLFVQYFFRIIIDHNLHIQMTQNFSKSTIFIRNNYSIIDCSASSTIFRRFSFTSHPNWTYHASIFLLHIYFMNHPFAATTRHQQHLARKLWCRFVALRIYFRGTLLHCYFPVFREIQPDYSSPLSLIGIIQSPKFTFFAIKICLFLPSLLKSTPKIQSSSAANQGDKNKYPLKTRAYSLAVLRVLKARGDFLHFLAARSNDRLATTTTTSLLLFST